MNKFTERGILNTFNLFYKSTNMHIQPTCTYIKMTPFFYMMHIFFLEFHILHPKRNILVHDQFMVYYVCWMSLTRKIPVRKVKAYVWDLYVISRTVYLTQLSLNDKGSNSMRRETDPKVC